MLFGGTFVCLRKELKTTKSKREKGISRVTLYSWALVSVFEFLIEGQDDY
jgi:1,2-phenylacetyl-CoA epoxidase catalytic subunit